MKFFCKIMRKLYKSDAIPLHNVNCLTGTQNESKRMVWKSHLKLPESQAR